MRQNVWISDGILQLRNNKESVFVAFEYLSNRLRCSWDIFPSHELTLAEFLGTYGLIFQDESTQNIDINGSLSLLNNNLPFHFMCIKTLHIE